MRTTGRVRWQQKTVFPYEFLRQSLSVVIGTDLYVKLETDAMVMNQRLIPLPTAHIVHRAAQLLRYALSTTLGYDVRPRRTPLIRACSNPCFLHHVIPSVIAYTMVPFHRMATIVEMVLRLQIVHMPGVSAFGLLLHHLVEARDTEGVTAICAVAYRQTGEDDEVGWLQNWISRYTLLRAQPDDILQKVRAKFRVDLETSLLPWLTTRVRILTANILCEVLRNVATKIGVAYNNNKKSFHWLLRVLGECVFVYGSDLLDSEGWLPVDIVLPPFIMDT